MHDADYIVGRSCLCESDIAITEQCHRVPVLLDYAVYQIVASDILDQCHCTFPYVFVLPWAESHTVAHMHYKRIHAVTLDSQSHALSFRNQSPDFFHHHTLVLYYGLCCHLVTFMVTQLLLF